MPSEEDAEPMLDAMQQYLDHHYSTYVKLHFHLEPNNPKVKLCKDMMVTWGPEDELNVAIYMRSCQFNITTFLCKVPVDTYFHLYGLPTKLEDMFDTTFQLHLHEGRHLLRGLKKSHIILKDSSWCLHAFSQSDTLMCHESAASDFPPVGRRDWKYDENSTTTMLLTSCDKKQFTCDSGDCISLIKRCDTFPDCTDWSDEDKCDLVNTDSDQHRSIVSAPSVAIQVIAHINVTNIPQINVPSI